MGRSSLRFKRFLDLTYEDLNCDFHLHTARTDGRADVDAILQEAQRRSLARVAFTEHVRRATLWFSEFAQDVRMKAMGYPQLQVLVGCEAKALDRHGSLDANEAILAACELVLGSVHRFPDNQGGLLEFSSVPQSDFARIECELALGLLASAPIDVLAHPGGMYARCFGLDLPGHLMREILEASLERGIAIEISSAYLQDFAGFLALCADVNPFVSIGSDMHRLEQLGQCRDQLLACGVGNS